MTAIGEDALSIVAARKISRWDAADKAGAVVVLGICRKVRVSIRMRGVHRSLGFLQYTCCTFSI